MADDTLEVIRQWLPPLARKAVLPLVNSMIRDELRSAFGYSDPSGAVKALMEGAYKAYGRVNRHVPLTRYPTHYQNGLPNRTYGNRFPPPEELGFDRV